ncbi:hypothetical protein AMATHDRAFT_6709 [Amanita thiersii Skay4041]|uniref:Crinkler effector protein N-terminal domain-containing protein n=1 Tax=Amanita thiersii Skay4041 TaxID=703135 RepID=A0A2A9NIC4_9AGAR|nr:hypothetical protein AMATHDRAFT_6709 [Amanita thiersii Skay4041]
MSNLLLLCCTLNGLNDDIFSIEIPASNTVLQLIRNIKEARNIPSEHKLILWKVTSPIPADIDLLGTYNLLNESKKLSAVGKKLSSVFPESLDQENLHIVVEFPGEF